MPIDPAVLDQVDYLCDLADELAKNERYNEARSTYQEAWDLLPSPPEEAPQAPLILAALGDVEFRSGRLDAALAKLEQARTLHQDEHPLLDMRIGQCLYDKGQTEEGVNLLVSAYEEEGYVIYEDEETRYFDVVKLHAPEPEDGWGDEPEPPPRPWWKFW